MTTAPPSHSPTDDPAANATPVIVLPVTGLAEALGLRVAVAPWLAWAPPHDIETVAESVAALARQNRPTVLIGHSTGGVIALSAAPRVRHTGAVVGVVVCDSGANMKGMGTWTRSSSACARTGDRSCGQPSPTVRPTTGHPRK
jgi:alpha-beta hydrolase superfamily lysophospholipase